MYEIVSNSVLPGLGSLVLRFDGETITVADVVGDKDALEKLIERANIGLLFTHPSPEDRFTVEPFQYAGEEDGSYCVVDHSQAGSDGERLCVGPYHNRTMAEVVRDALIKVQPAKP